jgi:hypothetical protein
MQAVDVSMFLLSKITMTCASSSCLSFELSFFSKIHHMRYAWCAAAAGKSPSSRKLGKSLIDVFLSLSLKSLHNHKIGIACAYGFRCSKFCKNIAIKSSMPASWRLLKRIEEIA